MAQKTHRWRRHVLIGGGLVTLAALGLTSINALNASSVGRVPGETSDVAAGHNGSIGKTAAVPGRRQNDGAKTSYRIAAKAEQPGRTADAESRAKLVRYLDAKWDPIHFKPAIDKATNEQCLACHQEILTHKPRTVSPAGLKASESIAWYQTLDTYAGAQERFHARHLSSPFAKKVMNLKCNFCHQGNDPREETPVGSAADTVQTGAFTLRKMVNPSETCLRCHGSFPYQIMDGVEGPWHKVRGDFEFDAETPNGCLTCHGDLYRTKRHEVTYLHPKAIEAEGKKGSDSCYGCHGGRAWYRNSYPYPRTPWPGMADVVPDLPEWAKGRPTQSEERFRRER